MALLRPAIAAFLLTTAVASVDAQPPSIEEDKWNGNLRRMLKYLWPALIADGAAGSIYYSTVCGDAKDSLPFPEVVTEPPSPGNVGLTAIREIFSKDKNVKVSRDRSGMIRITIGEGEHATPQTTIGKPQRTLLQTRIHSLQLDRREQYTAGLAVLKITCAKEFVLAVGNLGLEYPLTTYSMVVNEPEKGLPHLPAVVKNMTLEQALDRVAKTFGGIILYGTCEGENGQKLLDFDIVEPGRFPETMKRADAKQQRNR